MKTMLLFLCFASTCAVAENWRYLGVIGGGSASVAVLQDKDNARKIFRRVGQALSANGLKVAAIHHNKVVISDGAETRELKATGTSYLKQQGSKPQPFDGEEVQQHDLYFDNLLTMGEELIESGAMTKEQVNQMIAEEMQQFEVLEKMDGVIEKYYR